MLTNLNISQTAIGRHIHRRRVQNVITIAHKDFSRRYPQWKAALFDEHFLTTRVAPLLVVSGQNNYCLDPKKLAREWANQLTFNAENRKAFIAELTSILPEFLGQIEQELSQLYEPSNLKSASFQYLRHLLS
jgi:hypothetical protein